MLAEDVQIESSGTIVKTVALTGEFTDKDYDGKTNVLKKSYVVGQDLKTGDIVVYEVVKSSPVNVRKGSSGTIAKIDAGTGEFTVQDREGKTYVLKKTDIIARDLKTGDAGSYELVDRAPTHMKKQM